MVRLAFPWLLSRLNASGIGRSTKKKGSHDSPVAYKSATSPVPNRLFLTCDNHTLGVYRVGKNCYSWLWVGPYISPSVCSYNYNYTIRPLCNLNYTSQTSVEIYGKHMVDFNAKVKHRKTRHTQVELHTVEFNDIEP